MVLVFALAADTALEKRDEPGDQMSPELHHNLVVLGRSQAL